MRHSVPTFTSLTVLAEAYVPVEEFVQGKCKGVYLSGSMPPALSVEMLLSMANRLLAPYPMGMLTVGRASCFGNTPLLLDGYCRLAMIKELFYGDTLSYCSRTRAFVLTEENPESFHVPSKTLLSPNDLFHFVRETHYTPDLTSHLEGISFTLRHSAGFYTLPCLIDKHLEASLGLASEDLSSPEAQLKLAQSLRNLLAQD